MGLCLSCDDDIGCNSCCLLLGASCLIPCLCPNACGQQQPGHTVVVHQPPVVVDQGPPQYYPPQQGYPPQGYPPQQGYPQPGYQPGFQQPGFQQPGFQQPGYPPYQQPGYPGTYGMNR